MAKYSFLDDYSEGCHPDILTAMSRTNLEQQTAYGNDEYSERARELIRQESGQNDLPVFFVAGGTLANIIITACALRSHESVIAATTGHMVIRETGAIEAVGHKIVTVDSDDGKLTPTGIESALASNAHFPHMARPRLVYISNATEAGTVYSKAELTAISSLCRAHNLLLMLDGARLGTALTANHNDLTMQDVAELVDIFWIGGTKAGALIGEAIVIPHRGLSDDFEFHIKQRGALLAKGRLLGLQFETLFTNNLYFDLCRHANVMAAKLSDAFTDAGYTLDASTDSNQVFPVLPNTLIEALQSDYEFYIWRKVDNDLSVIRMVTSWATQEAIVNAFIEHIKA